MSGVTSVPVTRQAPSPAKEQLGVSGPRPLSGSPSQRFLLFFVPSVAPRR